MKDLKSRYDFNSHRTLACDSEILFNSIFTAEIVMKVSKALHYLITEMINTLLLN
jgi:hypothetical protein